jgi:hypothetical protein
MGMLLANSMLNRSSYVSRYPPLQGSIQRWRQILSDTCRATDQAKADSGDKVSKTPNSVRLWCYAEVNRVSKGRGMVNAIAAFADAPFAGCCLFADMGRIVTMAGTGVPPPASIIHA